MGIEALLLYTRRVKKFEIQPAIGAHGLWKQRLAAAVADSKSEFTPDMTDWIWTL